MAAPCVDMSAAPSLDESIKAAATLLNDADAVLVTCGAGLGVDSGLPDFRGPQGFWSAYPQAKVLGLTFAELANPSWFERDPCLAWGFFGHRYNAYAGAAPHDGYSVLMDIIQRQKCGNGFVFTTNVDGAWRKAGLPQDRLHEAHGSIHHLQCTAPAACSAGQWVSKVRRWEPSGGRVPVDEATLRVPEASLPRCPHGCGALARPNVYMFDDDLWVSHRADEQECRLDRWLLGVAAAGQRIVVVDIGSGTAIPTAREMAESVALGGGGDAVATRTAAGGPRLCVAGLIRINPTDPQIPARSGPMLEERAAPVAVSIAAGAKSALLRIRAEMDACDGSGLH